MKPFPRWRERGLCKLCGRKRGRTIPKTLSKVGKANLAAMLAADEFCSSPCARRWFGTDLKDAADNKAADADLKWTT